MKIKKLAVSILLVCAVVFSGCAGIKFYKDEDLKKNTKVGLKFYYPKPYLLVARTGNKDNPLQASVIYLPDLSQPRYAKLKSGYGTADLSLAFENGILKTIGQKTDTKIPETITAISGMATAAGGMVKQAGEYRKLSDDLKNISRGLTEQAEKNKTAQTKELIDRDMQNLSLAIELVDKASKELENPEGIPSRLKGIVEYLTNAKNNLQIITGPATSPIREIIKAYIKQLEDILKTISTPLTAEPELPFELYEIINSTQEGGTTTKLIQVGVINDKTGN